MDAPVPVPAIINEFAKQN